MVNKVNGKTASENDGMNDLGFPRRLEYKDDNPSMPDAWKADLTAELKAYLDAHPEQKKLPNRADSYAIQRKIVRGREKFFAILVYLGNGVGGSTNSTWMHTLVGEGCTDELDGLGRIEEPERDTGYMDVNNLDTFPSE